MSHVNHGQLLRLHHHHRQIRGHPFGQGAVQGAKFLGRFRRFFRIDSATKIIIYAWVNDENTLRKAGARTDPYAVFLRKLDEGNPPDDWASLLAEAQRTESA